MNTLTKAQRERLIRAHRIEIAENVYRVDFAPKPAPAEMNTPPTQKLPLFVDVVGGVFVLFVLVGAALGLFFLPGAQ